MKYIVLGLSLLLPASGIQANNYSLSPESKQFIVNSAVAGGLVGGGLGALIAYDKYQNQKISKHATTWDKIKSFPWHYVILPALAGAAGAGFVASFFTTEEYLKSAEQELMVLENDRLLNVAMRAGDAAELRQGSLKQPFPSLAAYGKLEALLRKIEKAKEYLFTVVKSSSSSLASIAQAALDRLKAMEQKIIDAMSKLKDSQYFKELTTRAEIDYKNQMIETARRMAAAAESQARAAHKAADATWYNLHAHHIHDTRPAYVTPPPIHVHVKR